MPEPAESVDETPPIDTTNQYALSKGQNLPNHSISMAGKARFVRQSFPVIPEFRTRQEAFRYAAWLITMAEVHLPDEEGCESHGFDAVLQAVRNA